MSNKLTGLMLGAALAALVTPAGADAYGAAYHAGYTHVGYGGATHVGYTGGTSVGYGGAARYGSETVTHVGYGGATRYGSGYHYGAVGVSPNYGYGVGSTAGRVNYTNFR